MYPLSVNNVATLLLNRCRRLSCGQSRRGTPHPWCRLHEVLSDLFLTPICAAVFLWAVISLDYAVKTVYGGLFFTLSSYFASYEVR
jgi:hypothetical protein